MKLLGSTSIITEYGLFNEDYYFKTNSTGIRVSTFFRFYDCGCIIDGDIL